MARGKWRDIHFPPRLNYSLQALKDVDEEKYVIISHILDEIAKDFSLNGNAALIHKRYSDEVFKTGLIRPVFVDNEDSVMVYFEIWSFFQKKYIAHTELESFEKEYSEAIFTYIFSVN